MILFFDPEGGRMFIETPKIYFYDPEGVVCGISIHATTFGVGISVPNNSINI